jgi:hypothetical protein
MSFGPLGPPGGEASFGVLGIPPLGIRSALSRLIGLVRPEDLDEEGMAALKEGPLPGAGGVAPPLPQRRATQVPTQARPQAVPPGLRAAVQAALGAPRLAGVPPGPAPADAAGVAAALLLAHARSI